MSAEGLWSCSLCGEDTRGQTHTRIVSLRITASGADCGASELCLCAVCARVYQRVHEAIYQAAHCGQRRNGGRA